VEEELLHLREGLLGPFELFDHVPDAARAILMTTDGLRPQTEGAARFAAAARVERNVGVLEVAAEIVLDDQIALIDRGDERQVVHALEDRAVVVMDDGAVGPSP